MNQNGGLLSGVGSWLSHPFDASGSALNWVLFAGLLIIAAFFWQTVLLHIREV